MHNLENLVVFRNLLKDPVLKKIHDGVMDAEFLSHLYAHGDNLSEYILALVLSDDNFYVRGFARGKVSENISKALKQDLKILESVSRITSDSELEWKTSEIDFVKAFDEFLKNIHITGYGIYAKHTAFTLKNGCITPVIHADSQKLSHLYGYEAEREIVIKNTLALLHGLPSQNVLLYGDAGTGKSSTVKAIFNEFSSEGLRLIEVKKSMMHFIPDVIDELYENPLKFILFIDDLSFADDDGSFAVLKAIIEGSVSARSKNICVYATSNRRHLVRENFSERNGDDVHLSDTLEEVASLASRFGLFVTFLKPDKKLYLAIVEKLSLEYDLLISRDELLSRAEIFALRSGGRTPRAAKQFASMILNEEKILKTHQDNSSS